jgi:hypothetical protein
MFKMEIVEKKGTSCRRLIWPNHLGWPNKHFRTRFRNSSAPPIGPHTKIRKDEPTFPGVFSKHFQWCETVSVDKNIDKSNKN